MVAIWDKDSHSRDDYMAGVRALGMIELNLTTDYSFAVFSRLVYQPGQTGGL